MNAAEKAKWVKRTTDREQERHRFDWGTKQPKVETWESKGYVSTTLPAKCKKNSAHKAPLYGPCKKCNA